jgi:hypothetical protein
MSNLSNLSSLKTGAAEPGAPVAEIAWRHFWLKSVMIDAGAPGSIKIARLALQPRKVSVAQRMRRLRRMRAILGAPR